MPKNMLLIASLAAFAVSGCVSNSAEEQTTRAAVFNEEVDRIAPLVKSAASACSRQLSGNGFPASALLADGYEKSKIGAGYRKVLKKGSFSNPNGTQVIVAPNRRGGCTISLTATGSLYANSNAITKTLLKEGWAFDRAASSKRKRVYRRNGAALSFEGGSYSSVSSFTMMPA